MSLEKVGEIVSRRVLGGIPFVGREDYIRDEIPAVYSKPDVFGTRFILAGEADGKIYYLEADTGRAVIAGLSAEQIKHSLVDISSLVVHLLQGVEGLAASAEELRCER